MAKINLCYNRRKKQFSADAEKSIEIEIYFDDKQRIYIPTGIKVAERCYDTKRNEINSKHVLFMELNKVLAKKVEDIKKLELQAIMDNVPFTKEYFFAQQEKDEKDKQDFISYCYDINDKEFQSGVIKHGSWKKYKSTIRNMEVYCQSKGIVLTFDKVTPAFIADLQQEYLKKYASSTLNKTFRNIKKFVDKAVEEEYIKGNPFKNYKRMNERPSERVALSIEELQRLEGIDCRKLKMIDVNLEAVLDRFLFSCYTGLRISDSQRLTAKHFSQTTYGFTLDIVTEKGVGKRVVIPLDFLFDGKAAEIAKKYLAMNNDTLFPKLSDQKVNLKLKTLAGIADIYIPLTFHTARHTCATMLAETTGNPFVIMQLLGHSDIETSMIYIHNSGAAVVNALKATCRK